MATYDELLDLYGDTALINKVRVAVVIAATDIMQETSETPNHVNRLLWAREVFGNPAEAGLRMMWPVLALNKDLPSAQIAGAADADVQTAVSAAVNVFAQG